MDRPALFQHRSAPFAKLANQIQFMVAAAGQLTRLCQPAGQLSAAACDVLHVRQVPGSILSSTVGAMLENGACLVLGICVCVCECVCADVYTVH